MSRGRSSLRLLQGTAARLRGQSPCVWLAPPAPCANGSTSCAITPGASWRAATTSRRLAVCAHGETSTRFHVAAGSSLTRGRCPGKSKVSPFFFLIEWFASYATGDRSSGILHGKPQIPDGLVLIPENRVALIVMHRVVDGSSVARLHPGQALSFWAAAELPRVAGGKVPGTIFNPRRSDAGHRGSPQARLVKSRFRGDAWGVGAYAIGLGAGQA